MTEEQRNKLNAERLLKVDTSIRKQVRAVLATLEHYGHRPLIAAEVWRDPALQLSMYRRGVSKLKWGFHCATTNGKPASLAADIVDAEKAWNATKDFWVTLGYAARAQGLGWGGYWGLSKSLRSALDVAMDGIKSGCKPAESIKLGWDVAHVETARVTVAEARAGKR